MHSPPLLCTYLAFNFCNSTATSCMPEDYPLHYEKSANLSLNAIIMLLSGKPQESQAIKAEQTARARISWQPSSYDGTTTTVSTPRYDVARTLQQYRHYIDKAKADRVKELSSDDAINSRPVGRGMGSHAYILAYNDVKKAKADVNPGVIVGDIPGVEVGDSFTYRHQMAVVGLHRLPFAGIDYGHPPPDNIPTATAVVMMPKAGYVDDKDFGALILYTGQGGWKKRNQGAPMIVCDQELRKGNLALVKNHERNVPVRVIRGHRMRGSWAAGFLGYSYDGLYTIVSYEFSEGMNGFKVYKYTMMRLEGQPPIPACIAGCTSHPWNTASAPSPLQALDPSTTLDDVKPMFFQQVMSKPEVEPGVFIQPRVELKQELC